MEHTIFEIVTPLGGGCVKHHADVHNLETWYSVDTWVIPNGFYKQRTFKTLSAAYKEFERHCKKYNLSESL